MPYKKEPILLNDNIFIVCRSLKLVVSNASELDLEALLINGKEIKIVCLVLYEMGYPHAPTHIH